MCGGRKGLAELGGINWMLIVYQLVRIICEVKLFLWKIVEKNNLIIVYCVKTATFMC